MFSTRYAFSAALMATGLVSLAQAQPTVEGNTISWPDDGWYQVQHADTYLEICSGGSSCVVAEPGRYRVINHSTGERTEVTVADDNSGSQGGTGTATDGSLEIRDGVISWPNDGWYQVQNALDHTTVCEGGTNCVVESGTYNVINHTTGERWDTVGVTAETLGSADSVTVNGNTISWPNDGWYQVQNGATYETVCEGGSSCVAAPGTYIVINHSTDTRYDNIVVAGDTPPQIGVAASMVNAENAVNLVRQSIEIFNGKAYDRRLEAVGSLGSSTVLTSGPVSNPSTQNPGITVQTSTHRCGTRGEILEMIESLSAEYSYSSYQFNDCVTSTEVRTGQVGVSYFPAGRAFTYTGFALNFYEGGSANGQMELDGTFRKSDLSRPSSVIASSRIETSDLNYYFSYPLGTLRVSNASYRYDYIRGYFDGNRSVTAGSSFSMTPPFSDATFEVEVLGELQGATPEGYYYYDDRDAYINFVSGRLRIRSTSDDSYLILDAGNGDFDTANITFFSADGVESTATSYEWTNWHSALCEEQNCQ